jgi:hypothetical protein
VGTIQEEQIFIFKTTEESAGWIKIKKKKKNVSRIHKKTFYLEYILKLLDGSKL